MSLESISPTGSSVEETWLLIAGDTEYAAGFSHEAFDGIKVGDSGAHVREILGEPMRTDKYQDGSDYLWYSNSPPGTHHRRRHLLLKNGVVIEVIAEMYFD